MSLKQLREAPPTIEAYRRMGRRERAIVRGAISHTPAAELGRDWQITIERVRQLAYQLARYPQGFVSNGQPDTPESFWRNERFRR